MEALWADWQVKQIASGYATKRPRLDWFDDPHHYQTSLKSWAHLCARQLTQLDLEERQMIIFLYHLGFEKDDVLHFDPSAKDSASNDYSPSEQEKI